MKFFLDTAKVDEIRQAASLGLIDGVTTNPSLVAKEGRPFEELIHEICELVQGPVSAEVVATEAEGMIEEVHPFDSDDLVCTRGNEPWPVWSAARSDPEIEGADT